LKYDEPDLAPSWMTLEVLSFGTLSKLYSTMTLNSDINKRIADSFGVVKPIILTNWFHAFSILRNYCAHHSRIWNRRFQVDISLPYNTHYTFIDRETIKTIRTNKIFASLCVIKYVLDIINPGNNFKGGLVEILQNSGKLVREKDMGFPENWRFLGVWIER
jgi:abortive infection bacteriophage resistance protein